MSDFAREMQALLATAADEVVKSQQRAIEFATDRMEKVARVRCHVVTGRLLKSIKGRLSNLPASFKFVGEVSAKTPYTHLVEFGTVKTRAYPFLTPAFEAGAELAETLCIKFVNEALEKLKGKSNG